MRFLWVFPGVLLVGCGENPGWKDPDQTIEEEGVYCYETLGGGGLL